MSREKIETFYDKVGPIYESFHYNLFFKECFKTAFSFCDINRDSRILEVGVGTGQSFPYYPEDCSVTGIDISQAMLKQAQKNMKKQCLQNISLKKMNAIQIDFPDNSFDYVMAFMVLSATKNPAKVLKEMHRVCKPQGKIVFGNHFLSSNRWVARGERTFRHFFYWLGFDLALDIEKLLVEAELQVLEKRTINKFWTVVLAESKNPS